MEPFPLPLPSAGQALWLPISWLSIQCWCCGYSVVRFTLSRFLGFSGLRSLKKLRFWCTVSSKTHRSPLYSIFPFLSQSTKLSWCQEQRVLHMPFQWRWLWISALSPSGGITKEKVFPSLLQKSAFRSDNTKSPSVCCPAMHGPLQTPTSSYAFPCVFSYVPHKTNFSLKPLTLQVSLCPHNPPLSHYTWLHQPAPSDRERLKGFWKQMSAVMHGALYVLWHRQPIYVHFVAGYYRESTCTHTHFSNENYFCSFLFAFSYTIKNPSGSKRLCSPHIEKHTFCQQLSWRDTLQGYPVYTFPIVKQRLETCIWGTIQHPPCLPLCQRYQCLSLCCYVSFGVLLNSFPKCHKTMGTTLLF